MNIKPLLKNRVFKTIVIVVGATIVLTAGIGFVIGTAIKLSVVAGAAYMGYKYVVQPMINNSNNKASLKDVKKYTSYFYDQKKIDKEIKEKIKNARG